jgi:GABA permease
VVIVLFFANRYFVQSRPTTPDTAVQGHRPTNIVVLANQTVGSDELLSELRSIGADQGTMFHVVVPASPIETKAADVHGPLDVWEATTRIANERLEETLATLRTEGFAADGRLGDYRPLRALAAAVEEHRPDRIVISTLPPEESVWERFDVIDRARADHHLPVTHVVARMTSSGSVQ